jgi:MarR family 2-MHQ and catechol resistance regulon transcriptional repressor
VNYSDTERFEGAYRRLWLSLHRPDAADLSQHELGLLHHVPAEGGIALSALAQHLALPKSTASVLVKALERRGFLRRARDARDERRLAIALTPAGQARVAADTVLNTPRLAAALEQLSPAARRALLKGVEQLAAAGEQLPADGS